MSEYGNNWHKKVDNLPPLDNLICVNYYHSTYRDTPGVEWQQVVCTVTSHLVTLPHLKHENMTCHVMTWSQIRDMSWHVTRIPWVNAWENRGGVLIVLKLIRRHILKKFFEPVYKWCKKIISISFIDGIFIHLYHKILKKKLSGKTHYWTLTTNYYL